jgi:hypothetical protein
MSGEREQSQLPIASLIAVLIAASGIWFTQSPLKSSRPDSGPNTPMGSSQAGVTARLWQDPFDVIEQHFARVEQLQENRDLVTLRKLERQIKLKDRHFGIDEAKVLLVMLDKSPYAEDVEQRLRVRYTISMALNSAGFAPYDSTKIDYFAFESTVVPYERYQNIYKANGDYVSENALVVWIPDSDVGTILELTRAIRSALSRPAFKILGPRSSTTLAVMHEYAGCYPLTMEKPLEGLEMFSYRATADIRVFEAMSHSLVQECSSFETLVTPHETLKRLGIRFVRTVGSDLSLANELLDELARRGLDGLASDSKLSSEDCSESEDKIALISEADTFYGRVLPATFAAALLKRRASPNQALEDEPRRWPCRLVVYTYLNGLDGEIARATAKTEKTTGEGQNKPKESSNTKRKTAAKERPEGSSQLDYAVRLAEKIESDNNLNLQRGKSTFRAIGILGSDVYDKLLLLQALHKRLPNAIFFTTDLDARLWHEDEFLWTRNLLIASPFDVRLNEKWNEELHVAIAPFRDGYQTALYLSTLQAVGWLIDRENNGCLTLRNSNRTFSRDSVPKLYEVGRHGPVDISVATRLECDTSNAISIAPERPLIAPRAMTILGYHFGFFTLVAAMSITFGTIMVLMIRPLWTMANSVRSWMTGNLMHGGISLVIVFMFLAGLVWIRAWLASDENTGEPFSLLDSVSIWSTELIRLFGIALALALVIKGVTDLRNNRHDIAKMFFAAESIDSAPQSSEPLTITPMTSEPKAISQMPLQNAVHRKWWARIVSWMSSWAEVECWINSKPDRSEKAVQATTIWQSYLQSGQPSYAVPRIALISIGYSAFAFLLFNQFETPLRPCRGKVSCSVDLGLIICSVLVSIFLSLWVFDLVRRSVALIEHVSSQPTDWPADVLASYRRRLNLRDAYLIDWLNIQFIAERTRVIGGMVAYPFIIFVVILAARNRYFDNWDFPVSLIIVLGLNALLIIATALLLKRAAEQARSVAIHNIKDFLIQQKGLGDVSCSQADQLQILLDSVKDMRKGAFDNIFQQPAVTASLLGALALLQQFLLL